MPEDLSLVAPGLVDTVAWTIAIAAVTLLVLETLYLAFFTVFIIITHKRTERERWRCSVHP